MPAGLPNTCSRRLRVVIGCGAPLTPAHPPDVTAAVPGALSSAYSRAALTSLVWGEAAQPPWPLIAHRYGNESKPHPGLFEHGPPRDADD